MGYCLLGLGDYLGLWPNRAILRSSKKNPLENTIWYWNIYFPHILIAIQSKVYPLNHWVRFPNPLLSTYTKSGLFVSKFYRKDLTIVGHQDASSRLFFLVVPCGIRTLVDREWNLYCLLWKHRVLTTGLPGKSLLFFFFWRGRGLGAIFKSHSAKKYSLVAPNHLYMWNTFTFIPLEGSTVTKQ